MQKQTMADGKTSQVKLKKRIQGRENYYLEMPINSEIHIVGTNGTVELSIEIRPNGKIRAFGMREEEQKILFRTIGLKELDEENNWAKSEGVRIW